MKPEDNTTPHRPEVQYVKVRRRQIPSQSRNGSISEIMKKFGIIVEPKKSSGGIDYVA